MSVNVYQNAKCYIPDDCDSLDHCFDNLKSNKNFLAFYKTKSVYKTYLEPAL
jgi:hypothetical protein